MTAFHSNFRAFMTYLKSFPSTWQWEPGLLKRGGGIVTGRLTIARKGIFIIPSSAKTRLWKQFNNPYFLVPKNSLGVNYITVYPSSIYGFNILTIYQSRWSIFRNLQVLINFTLDPNARKKRPNFSLCLSLILIYLTD